MFYKLKDDVTVLHFGNFLQSQNVYNYLIVQSAPFLQLRSSRDRYEGFMVDLLDSLADREGFNYQLRLSQDNM
jgi:hypothetical protein